jgi:hypothetical protein
LVLHVGRPADGRRKVLSLAELTGIDDQTIHELFVSEATGSAMQGQTRLMPTGVRPQIIDKIYHLGVTAPELGRLYPKKSRASPSVEGAWRPPRRITAAFQRDRRQS